MPTVQKTRRGTAVSSARRYEAEQTLAAFAATARDEVDMERLAVALLGVVEETMQPESISLVIITREAE